MITVCTISARYASRIVADVYISIINLDQVFDVVKD